MDLVRSKTLKKNRHGPWTRGLAITNNTNGFRFCFFELDLPLVDSHHERIKSTYKHLKLDWLRHRTGNGHHWISPTLVGLETWKEFHALLKDLNPKCPMTTLRIEPNKHPQERDIWFLSDIGYNNHNPYRNSAELVRLLNVWFDRYFLGWTPTDLKFVRYPLP